MSSTIRPEISDQDLADAREKEADVSYEKKLFVDASKKAFWDNLCSSGILTSKERSTLMEWVTLHTEQFSPEDFFVESGDRLASSLIKLIGLYTPTSCPPQVDFALVVIETIARTTPEYLSFFRSIANTAYAVASEEPEVKAFQAELQKRIADAEAHTAALAADMEITGKKEEMSVSGPASPRASAAEDLSKFGGLYDGRVFGGILDIIHDSKVSGFQLRKAYKALSGLASEGISPAHVVHRHIFRALVAGVAQPAGCTTLAALKGLKTMLKQPALHLAFRTESGLGCLSALLKKETKHMQQLYYAGFCLWLLTFNSTNDVLLHEYSIVNKVASVIKVVAREKVVRICFSVLCNLIGRSSFTEEMIGADLHRIVPTLATRTYKDTDINADMDKLMEVLGGRIAELSSFEMYTAELMSGALRKSPVHNEKFWRENAIRFEDNNSVLVKTLIAHLLSDKEDALEMACYDIGEFSRFHPEGKKILAKLDAKPKLMALMEHKDPNVSKAALLAVQKILIHKWDQMINTAKNMK